MQPILFRGSIITMDAANPRASALLVEEGRVAAVGAEALERAEASGAGPGEPVKAVELGGRTLIPGLTDAHHHFMQAAAQGYWVDVRPEVCPTVDDVIARMRDAPPGVWAIGWGADGAQQGRMPHRNELSDAVPGRPCMIIHASYHSIATNDLALESAGITNATLDPPAGLIVRDLKGQPTGVLHDSAMTMIAAPAQREALGDPVMDWADLAAAHQDRMLSHGFTHLCDACAPPEFEDLYRSLAASGALKMTMTVCPTGAGGFFVSPADRIRGPVTGDTEGRMRLGPLKVFMDGADRCALDLPSFGLVSAAARGVLRGIRTRDLAPILMLAERGIPMKLKGTHVHRGETFLDDREFTHLVKYATAAGFAVMTHALGNRAISVALDAYDAVPSPVAPFRIEHATLVDQAVVRRLGRSPVEVVAQPGHIALFPWLAHVPVPRDFAVVPVASLDDAGASVAFSTDQPSGEPDPWIGLAAAVARTTIHGDLVSPREAVGPERALAAFTRDAARVAGYEGGVLAPGRPADMVILNGDPLADGAMTGRRVRPVSTWVGGEEVWSATE